MARQPPPANCITRSDLTLGLGIWLVAPAMHTLSAGLRSHRQSPLI